ncbi:MAG: carbohydrate binding family 9 domain-containing protein, partial [Acidobacteria bacterium]|nr:carbohydrate binding family 9 domain-containing protein [Acidobacteriota bacterium]
MSASIRAAVAAACIVACPAAVALAQSGFRPPPPETAPEPSVTELINGAVEIGAAEPAADAPVEAGVLTGPVVRPVRVSAPPAIDGSLDDAAWRDAAQITEFVQLQPLDGAPATESTDVYLAYDSTFIYLAFRARYTDPGIIRANRSDRDTTFRDDLITVYFDTFLDQQRAYTFSVNAYGVQGDAIVSARGRGGGFGRRRGGGAGGLPRGDASWDALFTTGGRMVEDGFTAEMAIPFKSLR